MAARWPGAADHLGGGTVGERGDGGGCYGGRSVQGLSKACLPGTHRLSVSFLMECKGRLRAPNYLGLSTYLMYTYPTQPWIMVSIVAIPGWGFRITVRPWRPANVQICRNGAPPGRSKAATFDGVG